MGNIASQEVIKYHTLCLVVTTNQATGKRTLATPDKSLVIYLPRWTVVTAEPSTPGWGGYDGVTYFLRQDPPVEMLHPDGRITHNDSFFGLACRISPDGKIVPPQLPRILKHVQNKWGWDIDSKVEELLAHAQARTSTITVFAK